MGIEVFGTILFLPLIYITLLKVITFIDLAGHQKFLKTTLFGLTGHSPHYALLVVSAVCGLIGTAQDHLLLLMALKVS